jgi:hypothetical protein
MLIACSFRSPAPGLHDIALSMSNMSNSERDFVAVMRICRAIQWVLWWEALGCGSFRVECFEHLEEEEVANGHDPYPRKHQPRPLACGAG